MMRAPQRMFWIQCRKKQSSTTFRRQCGGDETIGRIASSLGNPIDARSTEPCHPHLPLPLEVCVVVGKNFGYPPNLRIRLEGSEGERTRDTIVNVEYKQMVPCCYHCVGFGHWSQKCRRQENKRPGKWNQIISEKPTPTSPATKFSGKPFPANPKNQNSKKRTVPGDPIADVES